MARLSSAVRDGRRRLAAMIAGGDRFPVADGEAPFRRLAEESLQGIVVHDGQRRLFANRAYARMFGYPDVAAVLAGPTLGYDTVPPDEIAVLQAEWQRILAGGQTWSRRRQRRRRLDGSLMWVDLNLGPIVWNGRPAIHGIQIDVTREVEADAELRRSASRFRAMVDNLPLALTLKGADRRFLAVNRRFEEWGGLDSGRAIGRTRGEIGAGTAFAAPNEAQVRADEDIVMTTGRMVTRERRQVIATGERRTLLVTKFPVCNDAGRIDSIGTISTDITELKDIQAQLERRETALQRNQAAILQVLRDGLSEGALPDRLRRILRLAGETLAVDCVGMWRADGAMLQCLERWRTPAMPHRATDFPSAIPLADVTELIAALDQQFVLAVDDDHTDARLAAFVGTHYCAVNLRASLFTVIRLPDGSHGHVGFGCLDKPRNWSVEDRVFAGSIAEMIGICCFQDELTRREQAHQRSESRLRAVVDNLPQALTLTDTAHRFDIVNQAFERFYGVSAAQVIGKTPEAIAAAGSACLDVLAEPDVCADEATVLDTGQTVTRERRLFNAAGEPRDIIATKFAVRDSAGEIDGVGTIVTDITALQQAQSQLVQREAELRRNQETLVRVVREGLLAGGSPQQVLNTIVQVACTTLGLLRVGVWTSAGGPLMAGRELAAAWDDQLQRHMLPSDEPPIPAADLGGWFTPEYAEQLERELLVAIEDVDTDPRLTELGRAFCHARNSGARLNALVQLPDRVAGVVVFNAGPGPRRWSAEDRAFARSIADLVGFAFLSERHRQSLAALDLVGQGLYVEDGRGEVIYANRLARRLAGAADGASVTLSALPAPARNARNGENELAWRMPTGETVELAVARTTLPSAGAVTVIADVTERNQRERERRGLEAEMRQAAKLEAVGRLASGIAHDFNNLLGTVLGFATFLQEDLPSDSVQHAYATRILKASDHAKEVVKQLLAFTRATDVERQPSDLRALLTESQELLRAALPSSTRLVVEAGSGGVSASVNRSQIHQILLNLCINANDALEGQPGVVTLALTAIARDARLPVAHDRAAVVVGGHLRADRAYARLTVTDDGSGMDTATLARVFDPFFTTKSPGLGTGLGLAVVHGIVAAYDGAYAVETELGRGTRFSIFLPLVDGAAPARVESRDDRRIRGGESVLVVDDEADLLDMMRIGLERLGYRVSGCTDPLRALEDFRREPARWDVVVTDDVMPGMKGSALVAQLRAIRPQCPIVLCTGFSDGTTEHLAKRAGAAAFFLKPVAPARVAATIRTLLDAGAD